MTKQKKSGSKTKKATKKAVAKRIASVKKAVPKVKAKARPKKSAAPKVKTKTLGHAKLAIAIERKFGGNISACARFVGVVMPALHRWMNNFSLPLYSSRKALSEKLDIKPVDWATKFVATEHKSELDNYVV